MNMDVCRRCGVLLDFSADGQYCCDCYDVVEARRDERAERMSSYTQEVLRTYVGQPTVQDKLTLGALGLAGEAGEVVDAIKKWLYQGHGLCPDNLLDEIGDVLWYLTLICHALDCTLDDAIAYNRAKMHRRYPHGFDAERSKQRA
jgi:NTP pyrophosphatase (non-canonical NTP hydrolase)